MGIGMKARSIVGLLALVAVSFLAGGFVDDRWGVPFGLLTTSGNGYARLTTLPGQSADVPRYSFAQGVQDAPRAEVKAGRVIDMKRCVTTMTMRNESPAEAQQVCDKIVSGMGE